jgi:RNA polymerase sigma factor (sigma-70 family)
VSQTAGNEGSAGRDARASEHQRQTLLGVLGQYLPEVYRYVEHRIQYCMAPGDLLPGELAANDVVDAVLLQAYRRYTRDPDSTRDIKSWLMRLADDRLESEVEGLKQAREIAPVHIEDDVPETPPQQYVSNLDDDKLDFDQPDEDLKLEDVVPDIEVPTPEGIVEPQELRQCVRTSLATMPRDWTRILLMRFVDGLRVREIARVAGRPEADVNRTLESARAYLREKLLEAGCTLKAA